MGRARDAMGLPILPYFHSLQCSLHAYGARDDWYHDIMEWWHYGPKTLSEPSPRAPVAADRLEAPASLVLLGCRSGCLVLDMLHVSCGAGEGWIGYRGVAVSQPDQSVAWAPGPGGSDTLSRSSNDSIGPGQQISAEEDEFPEEVPSISYNSNSTGPILMPTGHSWSCPAIPLPCK